MVCSVWYFNLWVGVVGKVWEFRVGFFYSFLGDYNKGFMVFGI